MVYVALLRGINVGGRSAVSMAQLKRTLEGSGLGSVRTYINSGNVIFTDPSRAKNGLRERIERELERAFGWRIGVLVLGKAELKRIAAAIPREWVNDETTKCDVMFLWPEVDNRGVLRQLPADPEIEEVRYVKGAVLWHIERRRQARSKMTRMVGTDLYKKMTIRNANTVRKLVERFE